MIFDGTTRRIVFEAADGDTIEAIDIYSRWKDWVETGAGAAFPEAFSSFGGNDLGGGVSAGSYFLLNTTDGWRIRPREAEHELTVVGNLYPLDPLDSLWASTLGMFRIATRLALSSLTQAVATGGGGGTADWSTTEKNQIRGALGITGTQSAPAGGGTLQDIQDDAELARKIASNRLEVSISQQRLVLYDDDGTTVLRYWGLTTTGGELVATGTGVQTRRGVPVVP